MINDEYLRELKHETIKQSLNGLDFEEVDEMNLLISLDIVFY